MPGRYVTLGGRRTYFPPFANERFGNAPYWACTFASLVNGANVAFFGGKPNGPDEIKGLAQASLDPQLLTGSRTDHMITAMRRRYHKNVAVNNVSDDEARRRLMHGYALVAGVTMPRLPGHYRRWAPNLQRGHRITLLGWQVRDGVGGPRILDPMARKDSTYIGEWIPWSAVTNAWWSGEQLWFFEGQYAKRPTPTGLQIVRTFDPERHFAVRAGTVLKARSSGKPRVVAKQMRFKRNSGAMFDALVMLPAGPGGAGRSYLRVSSGAFKGLYIRTVARGVVADWRP